MKLTRILNWQVICRKIKTFKRRFLRGNDMRELIANMHMILNLMKDFVAGYSSRSDDQMMIDYKGKRYMLTFEELCDVEDEDMLKTMDRYWRRKSIF